MRALNIAWKDVRHTYRNVAGLAMMLVAPLLLAAALGAAFGAGGKFVVPSVRTVVVNQDADAGTHIVNALKSPRVADLVDVTQADSAEVARAAVDEGEADVAIIIPAGLSEALVEQSARAGSGLDEAAVSSDAQIRDSVGSSGAAEVVVYKDPSLTVGPAVVATMIQSIVQSLNGARAAARVSMQLATSMGLTDPAHLTSVASGAAQAFVQATAEEPPIVVEARAPVSSGAKSQQEPNVASQVLVGMMIFFMLFGAATPARTILDEHRSGTLSRLFTTTTPRSAILGGKYIAVFVVVLLQSVILLMAGWLLLGANWGDIGPVAALTVCGALVASSLGLLTVSFAKTAAQAGAVSSAIFVFLALIGGNFVGTTNIGGAFALVRRFTPNGWLLEGWDHILYGGSWDGISAPVGASLAFSLVFFAFATFFFRRRYA